MPTAFIIGAGSGFVSAALFASAATSTALAAILFYLAPLPLGLAGLGWGASAAATAGLVGTLLIAMVLGTAPASAFALTAGMPIALLTYLALLSRPIAGQAEGTQVGIEWYPPGRLLGWAAILAGLLAASMILYLGPDAESYKAEIGKLIETSALKQVDPEGKVFNAELIARALPAAFAIIWLSVTLFNFWLSGLIVNASGHAIRPWPRLDMLDLPNAFFIVFTVALIGSFLPGLLGLMATGLSGALLYAYVLQGLAVLHAYTRGFAYRSLLLGGVYLGIVLIGWVAIAIAILGLSEPMLRLRQRATLGGLPPGTE
jgi:Predicted membrane protein (DUF2232)